MYFDCLHNCYRTIVAADATIVIIAAAAMIAEGFFIGFVFVFLLSFNFFSLVHCNLLLIMRMETNSKCGFHLWIPVVLDALFIGFAIARGESFFK
jgi:hypothetical protein